ncbi:VSP [Giardia lamblia P15]|uniref:VSP n=1 Tax=Giardia intestinalis (strain P15) TaxID=658858 RepID=E1F5R1_GIAIA|nr:VSP [Giardia lamblia P15]
MFIKILWISYIPQMIRATCQDSSGCKPESCNVRIDADEYCSECKAVGSYIVNGKCDPANTENACTAKHEALGYCTSCTAGYFLHKGGCYKFGEPPGSSICSDAAPGVSGAVPGVCSVCREGYFKNPTITAESQSCISCSETTAVDNVNGIAKCVACQAPIEAGNSSPNPAKCTKCESGKYLKVTDDSTQCLDDPSACGEGYFGKEDIPNGNKCLICGDKDNGVVGCKTCTNSGSVQCQTCLDGYFKTSNTECTLCNENCLTCKAEAAKCTSCKADTKPYFKDGADGDQTGTCVDETECKGDHFPATDTGSANKKVCVPCGKADKGGITNCKTCAFKVSSTREGPAITCTECATDNLSPLKDECMAACPAGTYANSNVCAPCHKSCASCQANDKETSCTACYPGHSLLYGVGGATGTCIKECTGEFGANCADGQCTADVGGAKYCAQCKDGYAPIDGVCTEFKSNTRNLPECSPKNGKCTKCTGNYALLSGGCYNTQTLPGKSVCKAVANSNDGKCKTCANGQTPDPATNFCPLCDSTCAECSTKNDADACTKCFPGYYKTGNKCIKCTESSNNGKKIDGVPNCLSCEAPANAGPVICYAKADGNNTGDDDGAGGSVNKGGLSTGAIAGISVAVIIVVGGLVGFLCWWFLCRGKA